jgi:hypothetical protein
VCARPPCRPLVSCPIPLALASRRYGWQCYLCNLGPGSSAAAVSYAVADAYHVKTFIEPLGLYVTALAGNLQVGQLQITGSSRRVHSLHAIPPLRPMQSIALDLTARTAGVTFAPALSSPASTTAHHAARPFSFLYLRLEQTSAPGQRPGSGFAVLDSQGRTCPLVRGAFQVPPAADDSAPTAATITWQA